MQTRRIFPWEISIEDRCRQIRKNKSNGHHIAITLYETVDDTVFRYRAYNLYEATSQNDSKWKTMFFFVHEMKTVLLLKDMIDVVIITRIQWSFYLDEFVYELKKAGIVILFDTDDLVFDLEYLPLIMNTLNAPRTKEDYSIWFTYIGRMYKSAKLADGYTTTNEFLANLIFEKFNKKAMVIENSLNVGQLNESKTICQEKANKHINDKFTIGYFSGTPTHVNDFSVCAREIFELLLKYDDVKLFIVGYMDFPHYMDKLLNENRIEIHEFVDYIELQRLIGSVDVNIAPLVENTFTNCKSELKFFEAAAVDTITCASPIYTFDKAINNNTNGFLCNSGEWYNTLEQIYLGNIDNAKIVKSAHDYVEKRYTTNAIVDKINCAYDYFI